MKKIICIVLLILLPLAPQANDSLGIVTTSGITFEKSHEISMDSEDLNISDKTIDVKYAFTNNSAADITGTVVFPLPKLDTEGHFNLDSANPFEFKLLANGQEKPIQIDKHDEDCKSSGPCEMSFNYHWQQTFPAHSTTAIEHHYRTGAGTGGVNPADYCYDDSFRRGLEKMKQRLKNSTGAQKEMENYNDDDDIDQNFNIWLYSHSYKISYILKTGANWNGPIKHFKMTLDKGAPGNLLSTCWKGFKKTSPTTFTFEKANFTPTGNITVLVIDEDAN